MAGANESCVFCQNIRNPTTTRLLHADDKVVARCSEVIPVEHIPTVRDLHRRDEDYSLVSHMLSVGKELLQNDAPQTLHRK